jgi:hypothetical protein
MSDNVRGTISTSEELLVVVLARVTMLEANVEALTGILLNLAVCPSPPGKSGGWVPEAIFSACADCFGVSARIKLDYLCEQFPEVAKVLREHATLPAIDARECFRKLMKGPKNKTGFQG